MTRPPDISPMLWAMLPSSVHAAFHRQHERIAALEAAAEQLDRDRWEALALAQEQGAAYAHLLAQVAEALPSFQPPPTPVKPSLRVVKNPPEKEPA